MRTIITSLLASLCVLCSLPSSANELALVPIVPGHVGLTVRKSPVVYFYISYATSYPVRFTLMDDRQTSPVAEVLLPSPTHPGYVAVPLADYQIVLEEGVQYRWFVSVVRDPDRPGKDIVVGGVIERADPRRIEYYDGRCDKDSVLQALKAGVWYDAFACVNELIEANPKDRDLYDLRDRLLRHAQVFPGLELRVPRCDSLEPNSPNNSGLCLLNAKP